MNARSCPPLIPALLTAMTTLLSIVAAAVLATAPSATSAQQRSGLPQRLVDTGLYVAGSVTQVQPQMLAFAPQYPLWSDGADKRRWMYLPPGTAIDASDPDAWQFPAGTRLWKEFLHAGRRVETRYIERRPDGQWLFGAYVWNAEGSDAVLAPERGAVLAVVQAPGGRYEVPGRADCLACHDSAAVPVLGVGALQLSSDRDPLAVHAGPAADAGTDLRTLVASGRLQGLPARLLSEPPRIAARTPVERAALGYLHGNCGHCHNDNGNPAPVGLVLAHASGDSDAALQRVLRSAVDASSRFRPAGGANSSGSSVAPRVIAPGQPAHSVLDLRMRSRNPQVQMPPLGTRVPDDEGLALVERWIANDLVPSSTPSSSGD